MTRTFVLRLAAAPVLASIAFTGCIAKPAIARAETASAQWAGNVSAADPRAEEAGEAMLRAGGNAVDAAIAVMLALNVVEPQSSGIGGGGFLVRGAADGSITTFDGREKAPEGASPDWFLRPDGSLPEWKESAHSGLSVGVPGNIRLAELASRRFGKLPWAKLFQPAIALARGGSRINKRLHDYLVSMPKVVGWSHSARALYYDADGRAKPAGTLVKNEQLARTFERIAKQGANAFYSDEVAARLVAQVDAATPRSGAMTMADLAGYQAKERDAVCGSYRRYRVCAMGPPTSGGVAVLQMLGQLERFDLTAMGKDNPVTWHLFVESQRLAYADRELYLADPDYVSVPVAGLLDREYLAQRSALIDPEHSIANPAAGIPGGVQVALADGDEPEEHGTSHIAAVDRDGTMVSYTSTIESAFGSGLMANGFFLNNELTDFSRSPQVEGRMVANRVEGGKRPRSSMSPTVIWDPEGRPFMAVGAAGGQTIPVTTARAIIGAIDFGLTAEEALSLPFLMAYPGGLMVEQGTWLEATIPQFQALGHDRVMAREAPIKGNAVMRQAKGWEGARDPRIETGLEVP